MTETIITSTTCSATISSSIPSSIPNSTNSTVKVLRERLSSSSSSKPSSSSTTVVLTGVDVKGRARLFSAESSSVHVSASSGHRIAHNRQLSISPKKENELSKNASRLEKGKIQHIRSASSRVTPTSKLEAPQTMRRTSIADPGLRSLSSPKSNPRSLSGRTGELPSSSSGIGKSSITAKRTISSKQTSPNPIDSPKLRAHKRDISRNIDLMQLAPPPPTPVKKEVFTKKIVHKTDMQKLTSVKKSHHRTSTTFTGSTRFSGGLGKKTVALSRRQHPRSYSTDIQSHHLSKNPSQAASRPSSRLHKFQRKISIDPPPSQLPPPPQPPTPKKDEKTEQALVKRISSPSPSPSIVTPVTPKEHPPRSASQPPPGVQRKSWISSLFSVGKGSQDKELKIEEKKNEFSVPEEFLESSKFTKLIEVTILVRFTNPNCYNKLTKKEKKITEALLSVDLLCQFGKKSTRAALQICLEQFDPDDVQKTKGKIESLHPSIQQCLTTQKYNLLKEFPSLQNQETLGNVLSYLGTTQYVNKSTYSRFTPTQKKSGNILLQSWQLHRALDTTFSYAFSVVLTSYQSRSFFKKNETSIFKDFGALIQQAVQYVVAKPRPGEPINSFLALLSWISHPFLLREWIFQISQKPGNPLFKIKIIRDLTGILGLWNSNRGSNGLELIKTRLSYLSLKSYFLVLNDGEISICFLELVKHHSTLITSCSIYHDRNRVNALIAKAKIAQKTSTNQKLNFLIEELLRIDTVLQEDHSIKFQDALRVFLTDWKFVTHFESYNMKFNEEELTRWVSFLQNS